MRDDAHGKRSLFGSASGMPAPVDDEGRRIVPANGATVTVDCARCGASSRIGTVDALARLARWSWWVPGRTHSRKLVCPSCDRRSWVRLRLL